MRSLIMISALAVFAACTPSPQPATQETATAVQSRAGYTGGSAGLSPSVFATWYGERRGNTVDLLLLVLWRGTPGWQSGPHQGSGRLPPHPSERPPGYPDTVRYPIVENIRIGTVNLGVRLDPESRTIRLLGQEVALGDRNAILVDQIDGTEGSPRIANVLRISPRLPLVRRREPEGMKSECTTMSLSAGDSNKPATPAECEHRAAPPTVDIGTVVRLSPELRAFVR
jgi:hypothetical protein